MGYIKKLKNNELVGGTDKHTIYPVTSAEAVFEEVSDDEFKSQKYLNNHITNERIVDNTIENQKLKDDTIDMGKLNTQLKTIIQNAYDASWKVKEEPFSLETKYDANDVVYDPSTNSSYVSLTADNQGNPVNPEDEGYVEGKWRIVINGISAVESTEVIDAKVTELTDQVDDKINDAQDQLDDMIADAATELARATKAADDAAAAASAVVAEKVADAQIGYFECNTAEGTPVKATTTATIGTGTDASTYKVPAKGSIVKIKMQYATTSTTNATLQFGNLTSTEHPLYYNGEPANASNSWDAGETLSVYWDGQYYQASNAMGGGSAVGKKKLNGTDGYYVVLSGETASAPTSSGGGEYFSYIKYPVKEGDVVEIKGKSSSAAALVWGLIDSTNSNTIVEKAPVGADYSQEPFIKVIPSGVDYIIINNFNREFADYEWYFAKKGSVGAFEIITETYLYNDLRTLEIGQTYKENEAVKTDDKQLLYVAGGIKEANLTDEIAAGDLKVYDEDTYKALQDVDFYKGTETDGQYAIGKPSIVTITVDSSELSIEEDTDITVTIGDTYLVNVGDNTKTITIPAAASATKDADIAALIKSAFSIVRGWLLTDNEDGTLTLQCREIGAKTITVSADTGETGLVITSETSLGNNTLNQYNSGAWEDVALSDWIADNEMWSILDAEGLNTSVKQNSLANTLQANAVKYDNSKSGLDADNMQDALDSLVSKDVMDADMSTAYTINRRFILNDAWTYNNNAVMLMLPRPKEADKLRIVSNSLTRLAFLTSNDATMGLTPFYCEEYNTIITLSDSYGITKVYDIPYSCTYIYFDYSYSGVDRMPLSISFSSTIEGQVTENKEKIDSLFDISGGYKLQYVKKNYTGITSGLEVTEPYLTSYMYPVKPCQKIVITGQANFVWLKDSTLVALPYPGEFHPSDYFSGWCECDENGAELYAAPDCHYLLVMHDVDVYGFEEYKDFNEHGTDLLSLASYIANRSVRYIYHTYIRTMHGGKYKGSLTGIGTTNEHSHRNPAALVSHLDVMLNSPTLDLGLIGTTKYALRNQCIRYLQALVDAHSLWTNKWQSSLTAAYMGSASCRLYRDGYMTQELYDSIRDIVATECDNVLSKNPGEKWEANITFGIYWKNASGTELYRGDSKSEEVGWYAGCLGVACALCQDYPNIQEYRRKFIEFCIISYASPSDIGKNESYNGYSLTNLQGSNITDDGMVINHNIIHPDYMASRCFVLFFCLRALNYANIKMPKAMLFNMKLVLSAFADYKFTEGKYLNKYDILPPYGEIMKDGSNYPYFPMGNDWGTLRQDVEAEFFSMIYALGQSPRYDCSRTATNVLATIKKLQDRFETYQSGRIVANSSENRYGVEEAPQMQYANVGSTMVCPFGIVEILTSDLVWSDDDWYNNE